MPRRPSVSRRLLTAIGWPVGISLTSWRYMWRTTPMSRSEEAGSARADSPPDLPAGATEEDLQRAADGVGPLFHRRYAVRIAAAELGPEELIARLLEDPNRASPSEFARFFKVRGQDGPMRVNDEFVVRMPGPWDGPVRVVDVGPTHFRLATMQTHLEAGQIEFSATSNGELEFSIESWARNGDRLSNLLYSHLRMAKEVQLHMWTSFLERVVDISGGARSGRLEIRTRRVDELEGRKLNFDPTRPQEFSAANGWRHDDVRTSLPSEPPGPPLPDGSWETARRIARDYDFAEPSIVRASFDRDQPLEHRNMLLELRFLGLRLHVGVRVGDIYDEEGQRDGRDARVWGWNYRTLEGHVEQGQMDWQVWKFLDSGEVEFRIKAFSKPAGEGNPIIRLGFRLFGRREQLKFLARTGERMARLTAAALR